MHSFLCFSFLAMAQFVGCIIYLLHFHLNHAVHTFYSITMSVAFLTAAILHICLCCLARTFVLDQCYGYLLRLVFEYCLHKLIVY